MKRLLNILHPIKAFFIYIVTSRIFIGLILNFLYFMVVIGGFISWTFKGSVSDWQWWIKVLIFGLIINLHELINNFIRKHGW